MKKSTLNFIINAFMFLCMSAIAGIGFLIKYTLISGQERWAAYGNHVDLYLLGMDRHQWGFIHLIIGYILLGLLALHIILHWEIITCVYNRMVKLKLANKLISVIFIAICALLMLVPLFVNPTVHEIKHGEGVHATKRNSSKYTKERKKETETIPEHRQSVTKIFETPEKAEYSKVFIVKGYMTLNEISTKYNVPTELIKTELNIPKSISDQQRLGWLKSEYDVRMKDIEEVIKVYQRKKNKP